MDSEPNDFKALVEWALWQIIVGITRGEPLVKTLHSVLAYVRQWEPTP